MTDGSKRVRKTRGVPIPLGSWWHKEIADKFGSLSHEMIAKAVTAAAESPDEQWDGNEIGKLRRGDKQPTLPLIRAISKAFPVTDPVFIAGSQAEAIDMRHVQLDHAKRRAQAVAQRAIETPEVTGRMTALIEGQLGPDEIEKLRAQTEANKTKRARRVLRDRRDRQKK